MRGPTNEELIADMLAVYQEHGYLTHSLYDVWGGYKADTAKNRFGGWAKACLTANIPMTGKLKRRIEMATTRCLTCDEWFDRPKDDKSCRRCKVCKQKVQWSDGVMDGWEQVAV